MNEVTITLPAINETAIASLETLQSETLASETEALKALRERYAHLARQNGYIRTAYYEAGDSNWSIEKERHFERDGKRVKALKCFDGFGREKEPQNHGTCHGFRLYLAESGEWIELERRGRWSAWQGSANWWGCGEFIGPDGWDESVNPQGGHVRTMTDAEVADEYDFQRIVEGLGKALKDLVGKIPDRMKHVKQRAEFANQLLASLL